jgi:TatD DNase family protein
MQLIDTHAHLDEETFRHDVDHVVARAREAGVVAIITIGTTAASSRLAVELTKRYESVYAAVGIQPNYVAEAKPGDWEVIVELAREPKVVAIGETGLDRYWDHTPLDLQAEYFSRHIELARERDLPFVVHCREAEDDVVALLAAAAGSHRLQGVMHSSTGNLKTAEACVELGLHISFAGMLTFKKNDSLRHVAARVPGERLLVETDAPYLAPTPYRGKRNEPAYVQHTAACLAETRGVAVEEIAAITTANARSLFGV